MPRKLIKKRPIIIISRALNNYILLITIFIDFIKSFNKESKISLFSKDLKDVT